MTDNTGLLVARMRRHDRAAFGDFFDLVFATVYGYAAARVPTWEAAGDLTQEALRSALRSLDDVQPDDHVDLLAWLFQIVRTRSADLYPHREPFITASTGIASSGSRDPFDELRALHEGVRDVAVCRILLAYGVDETSRLLRLAPNQIVDLHRAAISALRRPVSVAGGVP